MGVFFIFNKWLMVHSFYSTKPHGVVFPVQAGPGLTSQSALFFKTSKTWQCKPPTTDLQVLDFGYLWSTCLCRTLSHWNSHMDPTIDMLLEAQRDLHISSGWRRFPNSWITKWFTVKSISINDYKQFIKGEWVMPVHWSYLLHG